MRTQILHLIGWAGLAAGACLASSPAAGRADAPNRPAADARSVARGRQLYAGNCADCHGPRGRGNGRMARDLSARPTDLSDPDLLAASDSALFRQISRGRRPMPRFDELLSEEDRRDLVKFLRTLDRR